MTSPSRIFIKYNVTHSLWFQLQLWTKVELYVRIYNFLFLCFVFQSIEFVLNFYFTSPIFKFQVFLLWFSTCVSFGFPPLLVNWASLVYLEAFTKCLVILGSFFMGSDFWPVIFSVGSLSVQSNFSLGPFVSIWRQKIGNIIVCTNMEDR